MVTQGGNGGGSDQGGGARRSGAGPGKAGRPERSGFGAGKTGFGKGRAGSGQSATGQSASGKPAAGKAGFGKPGHGTSGAGRRGASPAEGASAAQSRPGATASRARRLPPGARGRALALLNAVLVEGTTLAAAMPDLTAGLEPSEAARAGRLASDTLRQMGRADRLLSPFLRLKPIEQVMNLLRLATIELARGGAAHGVVHAAVSLARETDETKAAAGLVNAVLRRVSENLLPLDNLPVPTLPKALRKRLVAAWGKDSVAAMEQVWSEAPPVDLTARSGDGAALAQTLGGSLLPGGSTRLTEARQISSLPGYEEGAFWVQDAAAALPAQILAPRPGERILDLCAAPGGKTLQLAAAGAEVTALDLSAERMLRVTQNLGRTGLAAKLVVADALSWDPALGDPALFDAVLLDAPCSATGTIRRHPDLPHLRAEADLTPLLQLQADLIDRAFALLEPGGRLVFCTCSLLPDEGEAQALAALERLPGLRRDPAALDAVQDLDPVFRAGPGELRIRPDHWAKTGGIDGFYIAAFRKEGSGGAAAAEAASETASPTTLTAPKPEAEAAQPAELPEFAERPAEVTATS